MSEQQKDTDLSEQQKDNDKPLESEAAELAESQLAEDNESSDAAGAQSTEVDLVSQLHEKLQQAQEDVLRAAADAQNTRRRAEQDVEKARKFALERFVSDLLPVVDNLERAMSTINQEDEALSAIYEGIELTYKSFQDSLSRHQVKVVDPLGEPFDPEVHQAMSMVPNPDVEPNTVIDVFQKGYVLNGRLVRPAMVVVAKAAD